MTQPTAQQRESYERDGRAVFEFIAQGVTPLLAAAAGQAEPGSALAQSAAVLALRSATSTRLALDNAMQDIRASYARARAAWNAGRFAEAATVMAATKSACARLYATLVRAVPAANDVLRRFAAALAAAPLQGAGFGLGLGLAAVVLVLAFAASGK